jgi:peptide/nickel transport system substrate-binding protein
MKRTLLCLWVATIVLLPLTACQAAPQSIEVTRVVTLTVTETIIQTNEVPVEVTRVVTETQMVSATPPLGDPDPATFVKLVSALPEAFDPALSFDYITDELLNNTMEPLITWNHTDPKSYVPVLATAVPSVENGLISADGRTYTFPIREGVTFHDGGTLEPHDVAYSIQRGLLQSDPLVSRQYLYIMPIMGYVSGDITEEIADGAYWADPEGLRANATFEELLAICEKVMAAVVADDEAGTVTITLPESSAPFMSALPFLFILDQEWTVEQGDWDGSCETWPDFYAPGYENAKLSRVINGTGPYRLSSVSATGDEFTLTANENYWRQDGTPLWEGGPSGIARIPTAVYKVVEDWGPRLASFRAGDADDLEVPFENETQLDPDVGEICDYRTGECVPNPDNPDGPLRQWPALPQGIRVDLFMNYDITPDSPYIGSGQLDGNGIPPDFFSDPDVRKAMATCFNYDLYNDDVLLGNGRRSNGPVAPGLLGYNEDGPQYEYDLEACAEHLAKAWGGVLPETGFRFTMPIQAGTAQQGVRTHNLAQILQSELAAINENYRMEILTIPRSTFFANRAEGKVPMFGGIWFADQFDADNWAWPYTAGGFADAQNMPEELMARFAELTQAGTSATDPAERERIYSELQQIYFDEAPGIITYQWPGVRYEPRYIQGYYYREGMDAQVPPLYTLSIAEP